MRPAVTAGPERASDTSTGAGSDAVDDVVGEARWPMAGAVLAAIVLTILLPDSARLGPQWLLPLVEGVLDGKPSHHPPPREHLPLSCTSRMARSSVAFSRASAGA